MGEKELWESTNVSMFPCEVQCRHVVVQLLEATRKRVSIMSVWMNGCIGQGECELYWNLSRNAMIFASSWNVKHA